MRDDLQNSLLVARRVTTRCAPSLVLAAAALTVALSCAVCVAAILAPAPIVAVPLVVAICVGCPIFAGWEAPLAVACLRADRAGGRALARLRQSLEKLPEIEHPLGL